MANNLANFIPQIWSTNVIKNIDQINVALAVCTNTDYEGEIRAFGDTVQVRTFGNITVNDYQRGGTTTSETLVPTKEALTIDNAKYWSFDVDDLDEAQNDINAVQGYTSRAGVSMSNAIDSYVFGFYSSALTANKITGNAGAAIDVSANTASTAIYELLVNAGQKLDEQNVGTDARWAIVTPYVKGLLLKSTTYLIRATDLGDAIVMSAGIRKDGQPMTASGAMGRGYLGQCAGMDIWVSNNCPANGANKYLLFGQGKPISYAAQLSENDTEAIRLENTFATRVRGLMLHGGKVFAEQSKQLGSIYVDNS